MPLKEPPYKYDVAVLKDFGGIKCKLTLHRVLKTSGLEVPQKEKRRNVNDHKLSNNIYRARNKVFEYALCNDWEYFVTLTISNEKFDRYNLGDYYSKFSRWLRYYSKKNNIKIDYLFIPEKHKNGAWHLHGLLKGLPVDYLKRNEYGYLDWLDYKEKFGYISIDTIKNKERCASYITKYISKDLGECVSEYNAKLYYCSRGLKKAKIIKKGTMLADMVPDFENEYVKVAWFDGKAIDTLIYYID